MLFPQTQGDPDNLGPLGDLGARGQRRLRAVRHDLRLLQLPRADVPAQVPGPRFARSGQPGEGPAAEIRFRDGPRGQEAGAGPRRVGPADADVPGGRHPGGPAVGPDQQGRRAPLPHGAGAAAAQGRRRHDRGIRRRHAQSEEHEPRRAEDGGQVGGGVR